MDTPLTGTELNQKLTEAEIELAAWATGLRSWSDEKIISEQYIAGGYINRGAALLYAVQINSAELERAINKVRALRLLVSGEGLGPWT